ncbi:MAG: hypothetical protein ACRELY_30350 [Polyangiaceae bacterium]
MPYREEEGALRARRLSLQTEIEALDHRARDLPYLELRKGELQSELAALRDPDAKPTFLSRNRRLLMWGVGVTALVLSGTVALIEYRHRVLAGERAALESRGIPMSQPTISPSGSIPSEPVTPPVESFQPANVEPLPSKPAGISIDFVGSGTWLSSNEVAGLAPLGHWNELPGPIGSSASLVDSHGTLLTSTDVFWTSGDGWFDIQPSDPNRHMLSGYIEQNGAPGVQGTVSVAISGLPRELVAGKFAVIVYSDKMGNPEDQVTRLELTAGAFHQAFYLRDAAFHDYPLHNGTRGYVVATGTRDDRMQTPVANCAIFKDVSATKLELAVSTTSPTSNNTGGYLRSPINGMQILPMTALTKIGVSASQ